MNTSDATEAPTLGYEDGIDIEWRHVPETMKYGTYALDHAIHADSIYPFLNELHKINEC